MTAWIVEARIAGPAETEGRSVQLEVEADGPLQAVEECLARLDAAAAVVSVRATTAAEAKRELAHPRLPELVGILDIQDLAGLRTKQRALQVTELPGFPPVALRTRNGRLWVRVAVESFVSQWPRRSGRPPATNRTRESRRR